MNRLSAYLRLMRISLLPTAWSNVLMGVLLLPPDFENPLPFVIGLLICSSCFYIAGMVFNDLCDIDLDRIERPERVLPSGLVSYRAALILGIGLIAVGLTIAFCIDMFGESIGSTLPVALILVMLILFYNKRAKRAWIGPIVMGLCRSFNVVLGGTLSNGLSTIDYSAAIVWVACAVGIYVAGITWFASEENQEKGRFRILGALVMLAGIGLLMVFAHSKVYFDFFQTQYLRDPPARTPFLFCGLLAMMVFPVVRRVTVATLTGSPKDVKQAVITSLLTIIMIDAAICYLVCPGTPEYALGVAALIIPAFLMCRKIMAT